ncbi:hypothetical protein GALMADRAFT_207253 [Galerina marginata CBS 339.88]|uniref:Uncharacterized protein n=1 Tax=Galerina marginata (strain CBS 339.88) TaxID=685588 RepID=A0A067TSD7_GALM3|nr:hypothetical protein GALMADRAFT_207253 [Galerina marginata CBS 339.88]
MYSWLKWCSKLDGIRRVSVIAIPGFVGGASSVTYHDPIFIVDAYAFDSRVVSTVTISKLIVDDIHDRDSDGQCDLDSLILDIEDADKMAIGCVRWEYSVVREGKYPILAVENLPKAGLKYIQAALDASQLAAFEVLVHRVKFQAREERVNQSASLSKLKAAGSSLERSPSASSFIGCRVLVYKFASRAGHGVCIGFIFISVFPVAPSLLLALMCKWVKQGLGLKFPLEEKTPINYEVELHSLSEPAIALTRRLPCISNLARRRLTVAPLERLRIWSVCRGTVLNVLPSLIDTRWWRQLSLELFSNGGEILDGGIHDLVSEEKSRGLLYIGDFLPFSIFRRAYHGPASSSYAGTGTGSYPNQHQPS